MITLGIIGIVAQMTIPTLMQDTKIATSVTGVKKAYSVLTQAFTMAEQENGPPANWDLGSSVGDIQGSINILNILAKQMKLIKNCGKGPGCLPDVDYIHLNKSVVANYSQADWIAKAQLVDGTSFFIYTYGACNTAIGVPQKACGALGIDVNGPKPPNQHGYDLFTFYITESGIIPTGNPADISLGSFSGNCRDKATATGEGCSGWVIYNGNMDYLKPCGTTLSWNGPTSCN